MLSLLYSILLAAGLSVRSIFRSGVDRRGRENTQVEAYIQKLVWADGSGSDLFAILRAYRVGLFEFPILNFFFCKRPRKFQFLP